MSAAQPSRGVRPLFDPHFGQQLRDQLRRINPHKPPKKAPPFPPNDTLRGITEPLRTVQADPYMPVCL
jgi:hypothetical protein